MSPARSSKRPEPPVKGERGGLRGAGRGGDFLSSLARGLLLVFFRKIEVEGLERLPDKGPMVLVANHVNGLVDPALLAGFLPFFPRFLAKSTLWKNPLVWPFLELAGAIPVYRRQDKGVDTTKNAETFSRCHEVLAEGGAISIFPEGRSHNEPSLLPLKTGVSRIVLEAEAKYPGLGIRVIPVGLTFDDRGRFRSRALLLVGESLAPSEAMSLYASDPKKAVLGLTEGVREALAEVTLNYPSWEEARLIDRAAEIHERPRAEVPHSIALGDRFPLRKAFLRGYREMAKLYPEEVAKVAEAVREYDELLAMFRLKDAEVASKYPPLPVFRFLLGSLGRLLVYLPLALLGIVLNFLPYQLIGVIARAFGRTTDQLATYKLMASLVFYPLTWIGAAGLLSFGSGNGWLTLLLLPLSPLASWTALRFQQRRGHLRRQIRAYFLLTSGSRRIGELRRRRDQISDEVGRLVDRYLAETTPDKG